MTVRPGVGPVTVIGTWPGRCSIHPPNGWRGDVPVAHTRLGDTLLAAVNIVVAHARARRPIGRAPRVAGCSGFTWNAVPARRSAI